MTNQYSTQSKAVVNATVSRTSLFNIACDMEGDISLLDEMVKMSSAKLANIGAGHPVDGILDETSSALALLDAANMYLDKIKLLNERVYKQAWAMPNDVEEEAAQ